jgi:hypothetical protein
MNGMEIATVSALSGLQQAQLRLNKAATALSSPENSGDIVDLSTEAVNLLAAKDQFAVNIQSLKVSNELTKDALSLVHKP